MTTISTAARALDHGNGQGLQAVLLDMDGTLVDTEDFWWQAEVSLFAELGYVLDENDRAHVVGGPMSRVIDYLLSSTGVDLAPADLTTLINQRFVDLLGGGVPLMPGAERLLNTLAAHGVPAALVSASHRHIIDIVLATLGAHHFAFSLAGDEVPRTKPHPDPYLEAVRRFGAEPARCVVVEDAPTGVRSAEAAGCPVIAVPSVAVIEPAPGRLVLPSLEHVDLELLRSLVASRV
ncbi:HAD family phosphatase [Kitasatospora sp. NBC_00240]|uniref:HAD family hydrolase n=1 Tax=Kitasatospora sp. NBC_00240 TaxID=2903567 RepID=UPI002258EC4F|nr:HAD family phosphatase [Kitasatospora sp. NBC_00240]MCX5209360.1 HAD family phosphatase [Kitasatospora sp. NBC_00240]